MATTHSQQIRILVTSTSNIAGQGSEFRKAAWAMLAIGVLAAFVYSAVLSKLVLDWWQDPNYSHGFAMPLFAGFVVWRMRDRLLNLELRPSWWGFVLAVIAMGLLIVGNLGAELFASRFSLLILIAGSVLFFLGSNHLRALMFPWSMLLLMIPIPSILLNQITFPLQLLASKLATGLLSSIGVPVLRDGNIIQLPSTTLEVVAACSGIRSLISLIALAAVLGYFKLQRHWQQCLLVLLAIPIAVVANSIRIVGTGLIAQYWDPEKADGFFHLFEGWVIFVLAFCLLAIVVWVLSRFAMPAKEPA